ncbi:hypothetical protein MN116_001078 [Schistosoma mekongi]|uniref:Calcyphosin-2 PH domain-containing protein n=1 Tax=Schistosoma mekongi TaxID=38744 RepID=A0AAE2D915_SCHME|nr:hypothetical protein MN116_001078 [Schistosoma mekongi]
MREKYVTHTSVPKLCLDNCSSSEDEPLYTVARGGNYSARSDSTVSWGTESLENSSRNLHIRPAVYPPWATHLPLNTSFDSAENSGGTNNVQDRNRDLSTTCGDNTQRLCSDLEKLWRKESACEDVTPRNQKFHSFSSMVTPKQLTDYSIRQAPGLSRPSKQHFDHLTIGNNVKSNLNNRIWFTARLLVFNTHDISNDMQNKYTSDMDWTNSISSFALRDFIGIGFPDDSTWALYEDHKMGVSSKPLPFLRRSVYHCVWGTRNGQPYLPEIDFFPGAILFVRYSDNHNPPNPLKQFLHHTGNVLRILITGVDRLAKRNATESELSRQKVPKEQWFSVLAKLHVARLLIRPRYLMELFKLQCLWRQDLRKRNSPIEAYLNLHLYYRNSIKNNKQLMSSNCTTTNNNDIMSKEDELNIRKQLIHKIFEDGLLWFRLPEIDKVENLDLLRRALDAYLGYNGIAHFTDYLSHVFGELPEIHRTLVKKVFLKMDPNRLGHIQLLDIKRFFNAPKWAVNQLGTNVVHSQQDILRIFEKFVRTQKHLEYTEFEAYYQAISITLGECPVDQLKSDATYMDLCSLLPSSEYAQNHFLGQNTNKCCDTFTKLVQDTWCI